MFDSLALTISDYLRIGMSDAYLLIFAFFLAIGVKFWLGIEKLNSFYFGLVTGMLIYFTLIGIANIPIDPAVISGFPDGSDVWISRCAYIVLFAFPIGSVVKWASLSSDCGPHRRHSHIYSDLSASPLSLCVTLRRTLYLVRFTTEWSIYQLFLVPRDTQDESSIYAHDFLYTGVAIDCACVLALPRISPSSRTLSQSLSERLGKWDDSHGDGGHSEHGWDHGHDDHGGWHGDIVVDHGHGWGGHH